MSEPRAYVVDTIADFQQIRPQWDDLWQRSRVTSPLVRAEVLENWLQCFTPGQSCRAVVVEQGERLVAALPLIERRWAGILKVGALPNNEWSGAGELLLDATDGHSPAVLSCLANALNELPWPLLRLSFARTESPDWRAMRTAMTTAGMRVECRPSFDVTYLDVPSDWEAFRRSWSKNHRHRLNGRLRRMRETGVMRLNRIVPTSAAEALPALEQAWRIEDSGWKGKQGTSVLQSPLVADYLSRLAGLLVPRRELEVAFLELDGQPIAFEILLHAKGVLHSYKVGYDEQYEQFDPGHVLMHELLYEACTTRRCSGYDCMGPNTVGLRRWRGETYQIGGLVVAPSRWLGQALLFTYRHCRRGQRPAEVLRSAGDHSAADSGSDDTADRQAAVAAIDKH